MKLLTCGCSSTNEKLDISNFIEGVRWRMFHDRDRFLTTEIGQTKVLGTYLYEIGHLTGVA